MANFNEGRQAIQAPGAGLAPVAGRSKIRSAQGLTRPGAAAEYNRRTPDAGRRTPDAGRRTPDAGRRTRFVRLHGGAAQGNPPPGLSPPVPPTGVPPHPASPSNSFDPSPARVAAGSRAVAAIRGFPLIRLPPFPVFQEAQATYHHPT